MNSYVYVIGLKKDLVEPYQNCYIGVTNNLSLRWKGHEGSIYTIGHFIRDNNLSFEENMIVIFESDAKTCFRLENELRPLSNMGLNEAAGGKGGYTRYSSERNKKISDKLSNKSKSHEHKSKISTIRKAKGLASGENNPRAKKWILTSPEKIVYNISGNLQAFCKEKEILWSVLMKYINTPVPPYTENGYGGFRPKDEKHKQHRINSNYWILNKG